MTLKVATTIAVYGFTAALIAGMFRWAARTFDLVPFTSDMRTLWSFVSLFTDVVGPASLVVFLHALKEKQS